MFNLFKNQKAFSMAELVMAITITSIGILGVFSLVLLNITSQDVNRGYLVASMLSQEGLEMVRNKRDWNWISFQGNSLHSWDEDIADNDGTFAVSHDNPAFDFACNSIGENCARLYLNGSGFYTSDPTGAALTPYRRLILVDEETGNSFRVRSIVEWSERGHLHNYTAETYLYNWRGLN